MKILSEVIPMSKLPLAFVTIGNDFIEAGAIALTETAKDCVVAVQTEMKSVFDKPTPYVLNSLYTKPAASSNLEAIVAFREVVKKGTHPTKLLAPHVFGGNRFDRASEKAFRRIGILETNAQYVPGYGAEIDTYGNLSRGQTKKILSQLKAFTEQGYNSNATNSKRSKKKRVKERYFTKENKQNKFGKTIYLDKSGQKVMPVLIPVPSPEYKPRLDFYGIVSNEYDRKIEDNYDKALRNVLQKHF